jgi:hypothetical protein
VIYLLFSLFCLSYYNKNNIVIIIFFCKVCFIYFEILSKHQSVSEEYYQFQVCFFY